MDVFSKGVVLGGLAAGSVLAALSAYVLFGAPWEERHGASEAGRGVALTWLRLCLDSANSRLVYLQTRSPGEASGTWATPASSMLWCR